MVINVEIHAKDREAIVEHINYLKYELLSEAKKAKEGELHTVEFKFAHGMRKISILK